MANTEDVLMEAYNLGIIEEVFKESNKIDKLHPNMEVADRFDMALQNIKSNYKNKSYERKK
tara:strand:+ start:6688 stop:6870 length:183 start_codon:yes stop_codon:yes gene_type:complete